MGEILHIDKIHCGYANRPVLKGVSLRINAGETVLLAGPNGCGKSTLLKAVTGLITLDSGEIIFDDKNITKLSVENRINGGIGFLCQTNNFFPGLTVIENLELSGMGMSKDALASSIDNMLNLFGFLKDCLNRRAGALSGGQRQALAIAMVLMHPKRIYLLDEPTAGLSPKAAVDIIESVQEFVKNSRDYSVLMVEHRLELLEWVNRAAILIQGEIKTEIDDMSLLSNSEWLAKHYF